MNALTPLCIAAPSGYALAALTPPGCAAGAPNTSDGDADTLARAVWGETRVHLFPAGGRQARVCLDSNYPVPLNDVPGFF